MLLCFLDQECQGCVPVYLDETHEDFFFSSELTPVDPKPQFHYWATIDSPLPSRMKKKGAVARKHLKTSGVCHVVLLFSINKSRGAPPNVITYRSVVHTNGTVCRTYQRYSL